EPYLITKDKEAIKIFQRVRDEAHRFGITYHRKLRSKRIMASELDKIEGIGPKRKEELLNFFGSIESIFNAELEDLRKILPLRVAKSIKEHKKL
ncbi:MAG: helix-hairpin-helix domain-containing protein, partial [Fusobacteriaceae bacterium]